MARSDMFLKATGQRTGEILGESVDKRFPKQIEIASWSWGMSTPSAVGGSRTGRTLMRELKLVKRIDKASTAFMSVMASNEVLSTAVLTVRKSGGMDPLPYLTVTLGKARITDYTLSSELSDEGAPVVMESLSLTFQTVTIDYTQQSETGASLGSSSFVGETAPA